MTKNSLWSRLLSAGPAIVVASVVLGPGSILTNSKVGWQHGYALVWVLAVACLLMMALTNLSMRVGVGLSESPCQAVAARLGRPFAVLVGGCLFLVAASFQFSNNLGVLFAIEPFVPPSSPDGVESWPVIVLVLLNAAVIAALLLASEVYRHIERLMKLLVGLMVFAFLLNLLLAQPSLTGTLGGLVPSLSVFGPNTAGSDVLAVLGLIATTFSVGGAFYQAYLVRQRQWTSENLSTGSVDSVLGIAALGLMSLMIMVTAAAVFHGNPKITELNSAADVAKQLQPMFGPAATLVFCLGILAGAMSSFLVNAMIGGCVLSDALGLGSDINLRGPRLVTVACLLFGMLIAIAIKAFQYNTAQLIVFAQSVTVLGNPLLAGTLLWLAMRPEMRRQGIVPVWLLLVCWVGFAVVVLLSMRTLVQLLT